MKLILYGMNTKELMCRDVFAIKNVIRPFVFIIACGPPWTTFMVLKNKARLGLIGGLSIWKHKTLRIGGSLCAAG